MKLKVNSVQLKQSILNRSFGWKSSSWSKRRYPLKSQLWKINLNGSKSYFLACTLGVESFRRMMELIGYLFLLIIFSINSMIYMICIKWILKIFDTIIIHIILNDIKLPLLNWQMGKIICYEKVLLFWSWKYDNDNLRLQIA